MSAFEKARPWSLNGAEAPYRPPPALGPKGSIPHKSGRKFPAANEAFPHSLPFCGCVIWFNLSEWPQVLDVRLFGVRI